jgi:molybdate transport system substrate-binding protein
VVLLVGALIAACQDREPVTPVRVAAAADLAKAFTELARDFQRETGLRVALTFGSSGLLAKQLREGAPFDMYAAASSEFVDAVVRAGVCDGATRSRYGLGRLVLWTDAPSDSVAAPASLSSLASPRFRRIAIAQPEHAPYGRAAREALMRAGVWETVEPRIVYTENVLQAFQLAQTHNVEAALVAFSVVADAPAEHARMIAGTMHAPIEQELVACSRGRQPEGGRNFAAYVHAAHGRSVMSRFGFLRTAEALGQVQ